MVPKIVSCSEHLDIPDKAGRITTRRRRTQAKYKNKDFKIMMFKQIVVKLYFTNLHIINAWAIYAYSSSYNLAPPISRVLTGWHLIFSLMTSAVCCKSPQKYTPVKYKASKKLDFQLSHRQPPCLTKLAEASNIKFTLRLQINEIHVCSITIISISATVQ